MSVHITSRRARLALGGTAVAAAVTLTLAGCSRADSAGGGESGEGVPVGASMEEFQEALADMAPTRLIMQASSTSPTVPDAFVWTDLADAVNEWSGGKIEIEITWNNGIVPVNEVDQALVDGRIDIATFHALYKPQEYPVTDMLYNAAITRDPSPVVGALAIQGSLTETGFQTPEVLAEFEDQGLTILNPISGIGPAGFVCKQPLHDLSDFAGKQIRTSGLVHTAEIEALGGTPVSMTYPEVYEALQRGIVDCAVGQLASFTSTGWVEVAPHVIMSDETVFATTPGSLVAGTNFQNLPLAAQQLIFDQVAAFSTGSITNYYETTLPDLHAAIEQYGGSFSDMGADASAALLGANEGILEAMGESSATDGPAFVDRITENDDKWLELVEGLGYEDGGTYADFGEWYEAGSFDPAPFLEAFQAEALAPFRPGS